MTATLAACTFITLVVVFYAVTVTRVLLRPMPPTPHPEPTTAADVTAIAVCLSALNSTRKEPRP